MRFPLAQLPDAWLALDWWIPVAVICAIALPLVWWADGTRQVSVAKRAILMLCKIAAIALLATCLLEPIDRFSRPEPGSNALIVMVDSSRSMQIKDRGHTESRAEELHGRLTRNNDWLKKLESQFELRRYQFDSRTTAVTDFSNYAPRGNGSDLTSAIETIQGAVNLKTGKPTAGIVLFTDGNASDIQRATESLDFSALPPIYPVVVGSARPVRDLAITNITTSQTNFESAPVTINVDLLAFDHAGESVKVDLVDAENNVLETQEVRKVEDGKPFAVRFQIKPSDRGLNVFHVNAFTGERPDASIPAEADSEAPPQEIANNSSESTLENNRRTLIVDRGKGPFRILYLAGRPNWEYKFLRRAIAEENELDLVGLIRVARKEPKFTFRSRARESTNPLYRGFGNDKDETAEQYDESVLIPLDTKDEVELRDGFPKDAATLFEYDAIVIDDMESAFFTEDQQTIVSQFVSLRGGGLLMLGGLDSFAAGKYNGTPIGESLPVYLDRRPANAAAEIDYRLSLTREGWVQPWVRVESTREKEEQRMTKMPGFQTVSVTRSIKPGATVLAEVKTPNDEHHPALVVQRFGKGQTAALLIGDLWRWQMQTDATNNNLDKSWRQMMRWLVSDVPRRVEVEVKQVDAAASNHVTMLVQTNDEKFQPQLNADVELTVTTPSGKSINLAAEQDSERAGHYRTTFVSRETGAYRVNALVTSTDGSMIEQRESGWVSEPAVNEFRSLQPNREFLASLAKSTGGELIEMNQLDSLANSFDNREVPITETRTEPWWHRGWIFTAAIGLLVVEWGARRLWGLA